MDELNYDFGKILQDSKRRQELMEKAYENSTNKEPVNYKENTTKKTSMNAKRILSVAVTVLVVISSGYFINNKIQENHTNSIVREYIFKNYEGIISLDRTDDNKYVFYRNDEIAQNIMKCENFDEAVYAAWYSMDYNKSENMNEVFSYLPGDDNFYGYLRAMGFVNETGAVDIEAYSNSMKDEIVQAQSGKGSK